MRRLCVSRVKGLLGERRVDFLGDHWRAAVPFSVLLALGLGCTLPTLDVEGKYCEGLVCPPGFECVRLGLEKSERFQCLKAGPCPTDAGSLTGSPSCVVDQRGRSRAVFHVAVDGNDANDGTGKTPFRTVTRALRVAPGGSFIWIRRGTYEEPITSADIRRPGGKSWDLPTVVMGLPDINRANGNGRQVTFAPKGAPAAIHLDSPEVGYLHFENLIIDGSGLQEDAGVGVWTQAVRDVHFVDLEIKNAPSYGASLESTGHGIELWRCQIHHNFGDQVFIAAGDSGVYFSEVSNSPLAAIVVTEKPGRGVNVTIEGNRIHEAGLRSLYPVYVNHALSTRIVNNVIYKADGGIAVLGNAVDTTVFHNTIVDSFGISVAQSLNTRVNNNLLVRAGITMSSMANIDMRNNLTTRTPGFFDEFELQYWLTSASPAIDFGMSLPEVPFDVLGTPRPQGALPDVGAYEFVSPTR